MSASLGVAGQAMDKACSLVGRARPWDRITGPSLRQPARAQVAVAPVSPRHEVPIAPRDCEESGTARPRKDKAKRKPFAEYDGP